MNNTLISIIVLFIFKFTYASEINAKEFRYIFQRDLYIVKNNCGDINMSYPQAFRIETLLPKKALKKKLNITFSESQSQFVQKIFFDAKTFFYPGIFGAAGHHEYEMPECTGDTEDCEFGFFVFISGEPTKKENWDIDVNIVDTETGKSILSKQVKNIRNEFFKKDRQHLLTNLDFKNLKNTHLKVAYVDPERILDLVKEGFEVEFVFSWRNSIDQIPYSEEFHNIDMKTDWLQKKTFEFPMQQKISNPVYLSFMVHARKEPTAFESKIVIIDKKQSFFTQCE